MLQVKKQLRAAGDEFLPGFYTAILNLPKEEFSERSQRGALITADAQNNRQKVTEKHNHRKHLPDLKSQVTQRKQERTHGASF
jgi:hypothetical protein